jgi:hypothetical protein
MATTTQVLSARELIAQLKRDNPDKRFATNAGTTSYHAESSIAVWSEEQWVMLLGRIIGTGGWFRCPNLLVNGKPCVTDWVEVSPC